LASPAWGLHRVASVLVSGAPSQFLLALAEADEQLKSSGPGDGLTMNLLLIKLMGQDQSVGATRLVG